MEYGYLNHLDKLKMDKKCYGKRPFPDREGEKACEKCDKCDKIVECSILTIKKEFSNCNVIG